MNKLVTDNTAKLMVEELKKQNTTLQGLQGTLAQLQTSNKTSLVAALNEVYGFSKVLKEGSGHGLHNSIFRGKNLGSSVTAAQWGAIGAGTFDDLFIGDYWNIGNVAWRIADFNYYLKLGYPACTTYHVVIVPDKVLYDAQMNETDTTDGGYIGSKMYTDNLEQARTQIKSAFGAAHILTHNEVFTNAASNGRPTGTAWLDVDIALMTENMIFGSRFFGVAPESSGDSYLAINTVSNSQLNLFRLRHDLTRPMPNQFYWLRDLMSAVRFASISSYGASAGNRASASGGVRPAFAICA